MDSTTKTVQANEGKPFHVEELTSGGWSDHWQEDDQPLRFASRKEALAEIREHIRDCREAIKAGHMDGDAPGMSDFRIVESKVAAQMEAKVENLNAKPLSASDIYPVQVTGRGEMFGVPSPENFKAGKRGFGDSLHATYTDAVRHIETTNRMEMLNAQSRARAQAEEAAKAAAQATKDAPINAYLDALDVDPMQRARIKYALEVVSVKSSFSGKMYRGDRASLIREMLDDGYTPVEENNKDGKKLRRLEFHDGAFFPMTKTELDYANWLIFSKEQTTVLERKQPMKLPANLPPEALAIEVETTASRGRGR